MSLILSYELIDDPGTEHEVEITSLDDARQRLTNIEEFVSWYSVIDANDEEVNLWP